MTIADLLRRENNNADLFRLIAAITVIYGHAYAIAPQPGFIDPVMRILGFAFSGALAVTFFFFLSGMLVTNSLLNNSSPVRFISARVFRIFPALIVSALVFTTIIGPILTTLPLKAYFANHWMYTNILSYCYIGYTIPGVFTHNAYGPIANGAIWTIRYELALYALLLGGALCGLFRNKLCATLILLAIICVSVIRPDLIVLVGQADSGPSSLLPAFFAFGALLALHKDHIRIDTCLVFGTILIAGNFQGHAWFQYLFYPAFLITCLWLLSTPVARAFRLPGDFSYGVYVFGWPVQQTYESLFPEAGVHVNQLLSIPSALLLGILSWYCVEKPCIMLGRRGPELVSVWISFAKRKYSALNSSASRI